MVLPKILKISYFLQECSFPFLMTLSHGFIFCKVVRKHYLGEVGEYVVFGIGMLNGKRKTGNRF